VALLLSDWDINAEGLHGNMLQKDRDKVMRGFRKGRIPTLVATDVAARGIDVDSLSFVIHFELPENMEYYLHRSGRTARAGRNGVSIVLASASEQKKLHQLERMYGITFKQLNR
jgi:ATP-dependent RNA helicase DeaD